MSQAGILYVVATPIGNLSDISLRALEVLQSVDKIAAEDTRHSRVLLLHHHIDKPMVALHDHNEARQSDHVLNWLKKGLSVALISDAGTPLISDPGHELVARCHEASIRVAPIPGACAAISALCASGLACHEFTFVGFLPAKGQVRKRRLSHYGAMTQTVVFYESGRRLIDLLTLMQELFEPERQVVLARELTKTYETIVRRSIVDLLAFVVSDPQQQRGEVVLLLDGVRKEQLADAHFAMACDILPKLMEELSLKQAVNLTVRITGCRKKMLYQHALALVK